MSNRSPPDENPAAAGVEATSTAAGSARVLAFEHAAVGLVVIDPVTATVQQANELFATMHGLNPDELSGMPLADLTPRDVPATLANLIARGSLERRIAFESIHCRKDGGAFPVDVVLTTIVDERGSVRSQIATVTDSSARALRESRQRFLAEAGRLLSETLEYEETLTRVVRLAVPDLADWAAFNVLEPGAEHVRTVAIHHRDPARRRLAQELGERYPLRADAAAGVARVLRTGEPELLSDLPDATLELVAHDAEHLALLRGIGFRSVVQVPLLTRGRVIGALGFGMSESTRRYDEHDLHLFQELASRAALAIENASLYAAERAAREEAERQRAESQEAATRIAALQRVSVALGDVTTAPHAARVIVEQAIHTLGAAAGTVVALDAAGSMFHTLHSRGYGELSEAFRSYPLTPGRPLSDAVLHLQPVFIQSAADLRRRYPWSAGVLDGHRFEALVAVPILSGERVLAALTLSFRTAREFDGDDRTFMHALGDACAQALTRVELYDAERRARALAEKANAVKTDFLAVMSHELRTPLNAIIGYTDLLALGISGPMTASQADQLGRVKASATHLLTLIDEILTFAKLDAGREDVHLGPADVGELAAEAAALLQPLARARQLRLEVECQALEPAALLLDTDAPKLRQVLINLLSNAVKFTDRGEVVLTVVARHGEMAISVRDTGLGIASEHLERIFEPFWQAEQARTRRISGTGLGLSVARRLTELLGGRLEVHSEPGRGSQFTVRLPLAREAEDRRAS